MFNNIKGTIKIFMNPSYAFKSVVALSTGYVFSKIVDYFSICKQEDTKMKELDIKMKELDIKKQIAFKELDIIMKELDNKKEIAFKDLDNKKEIAFKELELSLINKK
jgi:hypothetical protein